MDPDILILGAGLAGLAAARRLSSVGKSVAILEARDWIGGRVWSRRRPGRYPIELGAEWLDGDGQVRALQDQGGARVLKSQGQFYRRTPGGFQRAGQPYDPRLLTALGRLGGPDRSVRQALDQCCRGAEWQDVSLQLQRYIEGFHAGNPDTLSLRWLLQVERNQSVDAARHRSADGAGTSASALANDLNERCAVRLDTVAQSVRWKRGGVTVIAETREGPRTFEAGALIVTLPLSVLKARPGAPGAVRFTPALTSRKPAMDRLYMGHVFKVILEFREEFWRDLPSFDHMLFLQDFTQPFPTWWTMSPARTPLLAGWTAGPGTDRLSGTSLSGLLDLAVDSLAGALNLPRGAIERQLVSGYLHDWQADPFSRGSYTSVLVGGVDAWKTLSRPLEDTVFLAGEATCGGGYNATMEGAVASGRRAADQLLRVS